MLWSPYTDINMLTYHVSHINYTGVTSEMISQDILKFYFETDYRLFVWQLLSNSNKAQIKTLNKKCKTIVSISIQLARRLVGRLSEPKTPPNLKSSGFKDRIMYQARSIHRFIHRMTNDWLTDWLID